MQIKPTKGQLQKWLKQCVPSQDLFFIKEENLVTFKEVIKNVLVVPREEFFAHATYTQLDYLNSYMYWTVSNEAKYVIIAPPSWITSRTRQQREDLLKLQAVLSTGLLFPLALLPDTKSIPANAIVKAAGAASNYFSEHFGKEINEFAVIRAEMWKSLDEGCKEDITIAYAKMIDDWEAEEIPSTAPDYIRKYGNRFPEDSGSNCLSATLFAITGEEWILREWVHPQTFRNGLETNGYYMVNDEPRPGDVLTWSDSANTIQHATYYLERNLCFNKSGQTFFEPWKITRLEDIQKYWSTCTFQVHRNCNESAR